MNTISVPTKREKIAARFDDLAVEYLTFSHHRNYHRLHVRRDGSTSWFESINKSDDIIDDQAEGFAAVPSLAVTGTGSYCCNCSYCEEVYDPRDERRALDDGRKYDRDSKYDSFDDAIADAVSNSGVDDILAMLSAELERVPTGYFDDEVE